MELEVIFVFVSTIIFVPSLQILIDQGYCAEELTQSEFLLSFIVSFIGWIYQSGKINCPPQFCAIFIGLHFYVSWTFNYLLTLQISQTTQILFKYASIYTSFLLFVFLEKKRVHQKQIEQLIFITLGLCVAFWNIWEFQYFEYNVWISILVFSCAFASSFMGVFQKHVYQCYKVSPIELMMLNHLSAIPLLSFSNKITTFSSLEWIHSLSHVIMVLAIHYYSSKAITSMKLPLLLCLRRILALLVAMLYRQSIDYHLVLGAIIIIYSYV